MTDRGGVTEGSVAVRTDLVLLVGRTKRGMTSKRVLHFEGYDFGSFKVRFTVLNQ